MDSNLYSFLAFHKIAMAILAQLYLWIWQLRNVLYFLEWIPSVPKQANDLMAPLDLFQG